MYIINIGMKIAICLLRSAFVGFRCIFEFF